MKLAHPTTARRWLVRSGIAILILSLACFVLGILGMVPTATFRIGDSSGLRTIATVAVLGCLLAAVGFWDDA